MVIVKLTIDVQNEGEQVWELDHYLGDLFVEEKISK